METRKRSVNQIIEEQIRKWEYQKAEKARKKMPAASVVTISREAGSQGTLVAERLAEKIGYDLFHQEVVHEMAEDIKVSVRFVETLDERGLNTLENLIASLVDERYLWPDQYMKHLMKVIGTIGMHGKSVIVGRGANFILQQDKRISVRIYAPFEVRARNVAERSGISMEEAKRQIINTESQRRSFVRKYFNASISDLNNYDLALNTGTLGIEKTVDAITAVCPAKGG